MSSNTVGVGGGVSPDIKAHIDRLNRKFEVAFARGDAAGAAREVYTRDCRIMPPGAETVVGREAAEQFWPAAAAQLGATAVKLETVDLQALGDGVYEIGRATISMTGGQQGVAKYVVVWRQEDGQWRWHVDIWNMEP
jgi:uncharacterized protein (TIGR02246 family)